MANVRVYSEFSPEVAFMKSFILTARGTCVTLFLVVLATFSTTARSYTVYGAINEKYSALGREGGALGAPMSDEADAPSGGRFNRFQHGFIYWHPQIGAFATWGDIAGKWNQLGRVDYGYPITDELPTPDGRGRFNHFRKMQSSNRSESSIYWTPQTGAHAVYGAIRDSWAAKGWERSSLGYPIIDEVQDGGFRRSAFERGFIRWTSAGGAEVISTSLAPAQGGGFAFLVVNGIKAAADIPTGGTPQTLYEDRFLFSHPELCARFLNQPNLNATLRDTLVSRVSSQLPSGFGLHSQTNHRLGNTCSARTEYVSSSLAITIIVPGNRLFSRITTPSGFPGRLDPNFAMTYDLIIRTTIAFPQTVAGSVTQGPITASATNISRPETRSITGNLLLVVNDLVSFLGGADFVAKLRQGGVSRAPGVSAGVAELNQRLAQLRTAAPAGTRLESFPENDLVVLLATNRAPPHGPR